MTWGLSFCWHFKVTVLLAINRILSGHTERVVWQALVQPVGEAVHSGVVPWQQGAPGDPRLPLASWLASQADSGRKREPIAKQHPRDVWAQQTSLAVGWPGLLSLSADQCLDYQKLNQYFISCTFYFLIACVNMLYIQVHCIRIHLLLFSTSKFSDSNSFLRQTIRMKDWSGWGYGRGDCIETRGSGRDHRELKRGRPMKDT